LRSRHVRLRTFLYSSRLPETLRNLSWIRTFSTSEAATQKTFWFYGKTGDWTASSEKLGNKERYSRESVQGLSAGSKMASRILTGNSWSRFTASVFWPAAIARITTAKKIVGRYISVLLHREQ